MERWVAIVVLLWISCSSFGQTDSSKVRRIGLSYFSQGGFYPGFSFNYEKRLLANRSYEMLLGAKAGAYFHYRNQTGVFLMIQSGQRFRLTKHLYFEHFLGVGYLHTFLNGGDAYYVNASVKSKKRTIWGIRISCRRSVLD